jgi:hypothetical protein
LTVLISDEDEFQNKFLTFTSKYVFLDVDLNYSPAGDAPKTSEQFMGTQGRAILLQ